MNPLIDRGICSDMIMEYAELSTLAARLKTHLVFMSQLPPLSGKNAQPQSSSFPN